MKNILILWFLFLGFQYTYGGFLPNPLKVAGDVAGGIGHAAHNVITDSGKIVEGVAGTIDNAVESGLKTAEKGADIVIKTVAEEVDNAAKAVVTETSRVAGGLNDSAVMAVGSVAHETKKVLKKVHKGVFDINKGFVSGVDEVIGTPVNLKQVKFYLVTASNIDGNPKLIDYHNPNVVADPNGKFCFLIHGWKASINSSWYRDLSEILVRKYSNCHVVQVNWDEPASDLYALSAFKTESVGELVGNLIYKLASEYNVPIENFVLIGHSLGGQIAGWASKKFKKLKGRKLPRIIALDPAGPLFILRPDQTRLNRKEAEVVMVIHTDADKLGFPVACGTIDFFPNGGDNQPGCWKVDLGNISTYTEPVTCDHSRAWDYFVNAVNISGSFMSRKCESYSDFKNNENCEDVEEAMGNLDTTLKGSFYLKTSSEPPYTEPLKAFVNNTKDENNEERDDKDEKTTLKDEKNHVESNTESSNS